jgi:hypothetical protein
MASIRTACVIGAAVCCAFLTIKPSMADFGLKVPVQSQGLRDSLKAIEEDAIRDGGTIVQCENHVCRDLKDNHVVGQAQDGYYIVFPQDPGFEGLVEQYQNRVKNWVDQQ